MKLLEIYWYRLLKSWVGSGKNGLTIRFLIGAQEHSTHLEKLDISQLITQIALNEQTEFYLTYCTDINDLIVGIREEDKRKIAGEFFIKDAGQTLLFHTKILFNIPLDLDEAIVELTERYQECVNKGLFSKNEEGRQPFTTHDIAFIKQNI